MRTLARFTMILAALGMALTSIAAPVLLDWLPGQSAAAAPNQVTVTIRAFSILQFDRNAITVTAGQQVSVRFINEEIGVPHNFAAYTNSLATTPLAPGSIGAICTAPCENTVVFTPTTPGTFYFQCDTHPFMNGTFTVLPAPASPTPRPPTATQPGPPPPTYTPGGPPTATPDPGNPNIDPPSVGGPSRGGVSVAVWLVLATGLAGVALTGAGAAAYRGWR